MVKIFFCFLFFSLFCFDTKADPKNIKVIFLSRMASATYIENSIFRMIYPSLSFDVAQNGEESFDCVPYGEGCFHPQLGYVEDLEKSKELKKELDEKKANEDLKTINAEEMNLVDCDKGYYFDMYCGKAKGEKASKDTSISQNQLWIDISSSMRGVDFSKDEGFCERRRIVAKLEDHCKEKLDVYTFNTTRQYMNGLESTCLNYGTNNSEKLAHWLEESEATNVVIVTDVDEYFGPFREYLDKVGATIVGIGVNPINSSDLDGMFDKLKTVCK